MYKFNRQHWLYLSAFIAIFLLLSALGLWSFNVLSALIDGPEAQYRHALAAFGLLLILRFYMGGSRHRRGARIFRDCEHNCAGS
jgi:hypothetical protein